MVDQTLENKATAEIAENRFDRILYTDASVNQQTPGKATTVFTWYSKATTKDGEIIWKEDNEWPLKQ